MPIEMGIFTKKRTPQFFQQRSSFQRVLEVADASDIILTPCESRDSFIVHSPNTRRIA